MGKFKNSIPPKNPVEKRLFIKNGSFGLLWGLSLLELQYMLYHYWIG